MAELQGDVTSVPQVIPSGGDTLALPQGSFGSYSIKIKEFNAAGTPEEFSVTIPQNATWGDIMLRAAILKRTIFQANELPMIIHGILYADRLNLDIMAGDVYLVAGRPAISNKAKIKMALATGNIEGIETEIKELAEPFKQGHDLECTATISVKGWKKPLVRKARLSRWFKEKNPNWVQNPEHMLELNTVAHACEYVAPGGTDSDEAPPLPGWQGYTAQEENPKSTVGLLGASLSQAQAARARQFAQFTKEKL